MASRQNISGRHSGFGRGVLSKVYGAAQKQAEANRSAGASPGTRQSGFTKAAKRGSAMGSSGPLLPSKLGTRVAGPAVDMAAIKARPAPPTPDITLNPMPPAHAPVQRGMGAEGAALLASRGVTPGAPAPSAPPSRGSVSERLAKNAPVFNPSAMRPAPPPAAAPTAAPAVSENIAVPDTPATPAPKPGGSPRSQGMHRSRRLRAPEDRG